MAIYMDRVITLKSRPYRDHDALLTLFGFKFGKVGAVARGLRRPKSKLLGQIHPLTISQVTLFHGRSSLDTVNDAELEHGYPRIADSLDRLGWAMVVADVLDQLVPEREPSEASFTIMMGALEAMNLGRSARAVGLAAGFQLIEVAGLGPDWYSCSRCHEPLGDGPVSVGIEEGHVLCPRCSAGASERISLGSLRSLQYWLREPPQKFGQADVKGRMRRELEDLFFRYLLHHTGKPLKSREFLQSVHRLGNGLEGEGSY